MRLIACVQQTLRYPVCWMLGLSVVVGLGCFGASSAGEAASLSSSEPQQGLLLALSQFEVTPEGKVLPRPKAALLEILVPRADSWKVLRLEDPASNVFHKAMVFAPEGRAPGILTLGGTRAALKLWRPQGDRLVAEELWAKEFGGKFSRMRDAEVGRVDDQGPAIVVATHDQGVVALVRPQEGAGWRVEEIDHQQDTFVHEIELGDLDGDGVLEVYATPSEPNLLDGRPQPGKVVRYVPARGQARQVVADLGDRHAKEILVDDVDGDGRDELYVSVEAVSGGQLEIRRYDASTAPVAGRVIATLDDRLCRFLSAGDVDGDGRKELVAAASKAGLWLLEPPVRPGGSWSSERIDAGSSGFEHAALVADLNADGSDELYVASDDQGEVRRYVWVDGRWRKEVLHRREIPTSVFTWNLMPVPLSLVRSVK